jgi:hypothetical protein
MCHCVREGLLSIIVVHVRCICASTLSNNATNVIWVPFLSGSCLIDVTTFPRMLASLLNRQFIYALYHNMALIWYRAGSVETESYKR